MAQTILIKRSSSTATPTSLANGELAYSSDSNKLFVGRPGGGTGDIDAIGGKYYTDIIAGAASANTASKLVVRDGSGNFSAGTITATLTGTASDISNHDTDALSEGSSNLYYTNARADARIAAADTGDLSEGTNLYYTAARFNTAFTGKSTSDLSEGTNLYYTDARADARVNLQTGSNLDLGSKSTSDLSEGTNLYYTDARADGRISAATTDDLSEGSSNLYYTDARVSTRADTILNHANHGNISVAKVGSELRFTAASGYGDTDVQSYLSGGTGVTLSGSGEFSIGQAVATTSNVTFNNVTVDGTFTSDDIQATTLTASGNVTVTGDLTVNGTTTTVNSTTVELGDNILELNRQLADNTAPSANAGIEIYRGTGTGAETNASLLWNETGNYWQVTDGSTTSKILTAGNFAASFTGTLDGGTF